MELGMCRHLNKNMIGVYCVGSLVNNNISNFIKTKNPGKPG